MLCTDPMKVKVNESKVCAAVSGMALVPCGVCLNCRINQARIWTNRLILEATQHDFVTFLTMTYDDDHLPNPAHVSVPTLQKYIKRLRYYLEGRKIKYYGVGEYGDVSFRPHYHLVLYNVHAKDDWKNMAKAWSDGLGNLMCAPERFQAVEAEPALFRYVTGYITKKAKDLDNKWLNPHMKHIYKNKKKEFAIMTKGLGKEAIEIARKKTDPWDHEITCIRTGGRKYPIGRYLKEYGIEKPWLQKVLEFRAGQERAFCKLRKRSKKIGKASTERRAL